jgi:hypothetical protein
MSLSVIPVSIKSIAADLLTKHPELTKHIAKAIDLINGDRLRFSHHTTEGHPVYLVRASDGASVYVVEAGACTCPARKLCYHRVARGLLTIRSANVTLVDFGEAIAAEEEPPTPPSPQATNTNAPYHGPAYSPETTVKRVQSSGKIYGSLTIRASMDALERRVVEALTMRPASAKLH